MTSFFGHGRPLAPCHGPRGCAALVANRTSIRFVMTARCSASQSPSKTKNIPCRIRFIASVLLFVSFFKFLEILLQHGRHRAHKGMGKALAMRQEVPFPNSKDCSNSCNESSALKASGEAGNYSQEVIKTLKKMEKERTVAGPWKQSRGSTSLSLFSLVENKMTSRKSEKTVVLYSTNVSTIGVQKNSPPRATNVSGLLKAVVHWEYYFSDSNKIVLSQVVLESAAQYAEAYTKSAKQRWVALSRNHSRSAPAKQDDAQPNIKRIWIWGVFGHLCAILTRNGLVTHMLSAGERCSCTTAVTDLFLRNFDVQCSEGGINASASSAQGTTKSAVSRKCVIGGLPWKHGRFLPQQISFLSPKMRGHLKRLPEVRAKRQPQECKRALRSPFSLISIRREA